MTNIAIRTRTPPKNICTVKDRRFLVPTTATNITWQLLLGVSITDVAVVLASGKKKVKSQ